MNLSAVQTGRRLTAGFSVSLPDNSLDLSGSPRKFFHRRYHGVHTGVSTAGRSHCPLSAGSFANSVSLLPAPSRAPILLKLGF